MLRQQEHSTHLPVGSLDRNIGSKSSNISGLIETADFLTVPSLGDCQKMTLRLTQGSPRFPKKARLTSSWIASKSLKQASKNFLLNKLFCYLENLSSLDQCSPEQNTDASKV